MKTTLLVAALLLAVPVVALAPTAEACNPVYTEFEVGPVKVVKRTLCATPEVYLNDERVLP